MLTIVKFFTNYDKTKPNRIISLTLLKFAHISRNWTFHNWGKEDYPRNQEFWKVRVVEERSHGVNRGNFLVDPISKIKTSEITHIPATMFTTELVNGVLIVTPVTTEHSWILPKDHKREMAESTGAYAVVVNMGGIPWFENS